MRLTRSYRFSASHRLHSHELSPAENSELYGKCNNPFGHGHDYVLEVSVEGNPDDVTGRVLDIGALDRFVHTVVLDDLDHRDLNNDLEDFRNLVPTTENLAVVIEGRLREDWKRKFPQVSLRRIYLGETKRNSFELVTNENE